MSGNILPISNIINISVSQSNLGVNAYNTSNLGLFSDEVPAMSFGSAGFKLYVDAPTVGIDFGTTSKTYAMALAVFSQQPNILAGNGQLVVILMPPATETWTFSGVAASGAFVVNWNSVATASLPYTSTASAIQTALRAIPGLGAVTVTGSIASESIVVSMAGVYGAAPGAFTFTSNTLATSGITAITITNAITGGITLAAAITASVSLVQYFGVLVTETVDALGLGSTDLLAAAAVIQALNKIGFFVSYLNADIQPGGMIDELRTGSFTQSRGLYYGDNTTLNGYVGLNAMSMAAAYAGLGLSVNFNGSNTTITMNLKTLSGIQPDPTMTQTIYNYAVASGADIYVSIQGDPAVICMGANNFYDAVYNLRWFVGALQVAGYNFLAQSSTKIPQTEVGMDGFKSAFRTVAQQAVTNQYLAPGTWTNPTTFGVQALFFSNIAQFGYYIYSQPIAQQLQTARAARQAPLCQIAIFPAGAIQSGGVIVYVNN